MPQGAQLTQNKFPPVMPAKPAKWVFSNVLLLSLWHNAFLLKWKHIALTQRHRRSVWLVHKPSLDIHILVHARSCPGFIEISVSPNLLPASTCLQRQQTAEPSAAAAAAAAAAPCCSKNERESYWPFLRGGESAVVLPGQWLTTVYQRGICSPQFSKPERNFWIKEPISNTYALSQSESYLNETHFWS